MRFTNTKALVLAGALALATAACGSDGGSGDTKVADSPKFEAGTTMAKLAKAGKLTVGTKFDQPGFGKLGLSDKPEGFDVKVAEIIAGELGIKPEDITWKEATSAVREQVIDDGTVDYVVATYTINDERKKKITFAGPYYVAGQQLMTKADNDTIKGPEDLKGNPDVKVCSVDGSTPSENIREYLASTKQLVLFDVYEKCVAALDKGTDGVGAVTTDNVILLGFAADSKGAFKLVGKQFTEEPYGIGVKKGDVAFCEFINKTLKDNEDAYNKAWADTAGKIEGTQAPELPDAAACS